jgi:tetratricopeptide (TPR) repeat protein
MIRAAWILTAALSVPGAAVAGLAASQPAAPLTADQLAEVYELYLRGREQAQGFDPAGDAAAIATYRKALDVAPRAADLRAALATLLAQNQQLAEARVEARRAIEVDEDNREAHRVLGLIEAAEIQQAPDAATPAMLQEAIGHLEYALAGGPTDLAVELTIAELYLQHGNPARAAAAARRFLEDRPGFPRAVMVLVSALDASGRSEEIPAALAELRELPAAELLALADSFREEGALGHVVTLLEPRVKEPLPADVQSGAFGRMAAVLGMALIELGDSKRALAVMEDARARQGGGLPLLFFLAAAYERDGQHAAAERTYRALLADDPAHAPSLNNLGYMLADRGEKLDEAVELIRRALALDRDNPGYLDSLGWAYFRLRRFEQALDPLERAARAMPGTSVVQAHLGDLYLEMKRYGEAAAAFERALGGDRQDVDVAALTEKRDRARTLAGP